jgi:hypothetical protein
MWGVDMADQEDKRGNGNDRRGTDRRVAADPTFTGPERRKGDRRLHERRNT